MLIYLYLLIFFLGASLGSFYHVVGYRMPIGQNWANDRSRCPQCQTQLRWFELLPVMSYFIQGGKCRTCGVHIKWIYALSELIAGLLFVWPVVHYGLLGFETGEIWVAWVFASVLIIITVSDIYYQLISDKVLVFWGAVLVMLYVVFPSYSLVAGLVSAAIGFMVLLLVGWLGQLMFKKEALGGGDIKLYAVVGFVLGVGPTLLSIFMASVLALLYLLLFAKDKTKAIGFGPFIATAAYICLFYGQTVLDWYFGLF